MLQDLVLAAVNDAIARSKELERERMGAARRRHGPPRHAGPGRLDPRPALSAWPD